MQSYVISRVTIDSPYTDEELSAVLEDAMVAGIPVTRLIETMLLGLATDQLFEQYQRWLDRQIKDPDPSLTAYAHYTASDVMDIYQFLFDELFNFFKRTPALFSIRGNIYNVRVRLLTDTYMQVEYVATSDCHSTRPQLRF